MLSIPPYSKSQLEPSLPLATGQRFLAAFIGGRLFFLITVIFSITAFASDPNLSLIEAIKSADTTATEKLLKNKIDINQSETDGMTALHYAVLNNDADLTKTLLRAEVNINARTRYGVTPIYLAAQNGSAALMKTLLKAGANPNEIYREGETVLHTASRTGDYETVKLLLKAGAVVDARESWHGQTPLMWAAAQHNATIIPLLIKNGADVNAISNIEEWERQTTKEPRAKWLPPGGMSPLLFAAREGCLDCLQPLLKAGANIDATTPKQISSLLIAIINGHYDVAWHLVQAGANVNINDDTNRSPLHAAVEFNIMPESNRPAPYILHNQHSAFELIKLLLDKGANVNVQLTEMVPYRLKLDRGADGMLTAGTTPFLRAAKAADIAVMNLLLEYGADASLTTDAGIDSLMTTANLETKEADSTGRYKTQAQIIDAIKICQQQGLTVNAKSKLGRTAVFGAATWGLTDVVKYLYEQGAELDYTDERGLSPLDAAKGKAGGFGFVGADGVYWEETVEFIEEKIQHHQ